MFQPAYSQQLSGTDKIQISWLVSGHRHRLPDSLSNFSKRDTSIILPRIRSYILHQFYYSGYFSGSIDSEKITQKGITSEYVFFSTRNNRYITGDIALKRTDKDSTGILTDWHPEYLKKGKSYSQKKLEEDINRLIRIYEEAGYPLVRIDISHIGLNTNPDKVTINLKVHSGPKIIISGVIISNVKKNDQKYLAKMTGIRDSSLATPHVLEMGRLNLQNSDLFESVSDGNVIEKEKRYYVQYRVDEKNPNAFDLLVGYVPKPNGGGTIVGNGDLLLRNAIWNGSKLQLSFNRLQKYVTKLNIGYHKNWLFNIPFGLGGDFYFLQQDTSYQIRDLTLQSTYNLNSATQISASIRRQVVATNANIANPPAVLDGNAVFGGLGLSYQNIDNLSVPQSGVKLTIKIETGVKRISDNRFIQDTTDSRIPQKILHFDLQPYFNPFRRQVLTFSIHGYFIESKYVTESDLYRFGGANSIRGYREDQFKASRMLWGDVEYRYLLDPTSYIFVFGADGTYLRPRLTIGDKTIAKQVGWLHSFGIGFSFHTRLGQLKFTYAKSPEDSFSNAKVHISISGNI
jgi:outer membrane protein insertion porin family